MKCLLCGKEYIALGVHLRHKHHIDPDDYRDEFGILRVTPLVDDDLSAQLSAGAKRRLQDDDYKAEVTERCLLNAKQNIGSAGTVMSKTGRKLVAERNIAANARYIEAQLPKIKAALDTGTVLDLRRTTGIGNDTVKRLLEKRLLVVDKARNVAIRKERAAAAQRTKALARVAKAMQHFDTTKSAAEMCRLSGISYKTYKNWRSAELIPMHPGRKRSQA